MGTVSRMPPPHNYTVAFVEERAFSHLLSGVHTISFSLHSAVSPLLFEFLSRNLEPNNDNKTHVNGYSVSENVIGHLHDDVRWRWVTTTRMLCQYPSANRQRIPAKHSGSCSHPTPSNVVGLLDKIAHSAISRPRHEDNNYFV